MKTRRIRVSVLAVATALLLESGRLWGSWASVDLSVPIQSDPGLVHNSVTSFKVFYKGANGHLWYVPDGGGKGWVGVPVDLGGAYPTAAPSAVVYGAGYRVFFRGTNGHLWYAPYDGGQWWGAAVDLGGAYPTAATSAVVQAGSKLRVFYRGSNKHLFLSAYDGGQWWGPAWDLGGVDLTSDPAAVVPYGQPSHMRVFYRGPNGHLWMSSHDGGQWWSAPSDLGGNVLGTGPAVYSDAAGITVIYGDARKELTRRTWSAASGWGPEQAIGVFIAGVPSATRYNEIFYRGSNGNLWVAFQPTL
jgi:hypothetical protein